MAKAITIPKTLTKTRKSRAPRNCRTDGRKTLRKDCEGKPIRLSEEERGRPGGKGYSNWQAPEDMPDQMVLQVMAGKMCGALKKKPKDPANKYCKSRKTIPKANGRPAPCRCKLHGGASTGPSLGSQNNLKHGIYSQAVLPGEEELYEQIKAGTVDEEIRMTKLRLARAVKAEAAAEAALGEGEDLSEFRVTEEVSESTGFSADSPTANRTVKTKLPNFKRIIHDIITQLVKLENQKFVIDSGGAGELTPEERAERARAFLAEAKKTVGVK